jgi:hypothetical protein
MVRFLFSSMVELCHYTMTALEDATEVMCSTPTLCRGKTESQAAADFGPFGFFFFLRFNLFPSTHIN